MLKSFFLVEKDHMKHFDEKAHLRDKLQNLGFLGFSKIKIIKVRYAYLRAVLPKMK